MSSDSASTISKKLSKPLFHVVVVCSSVPELLPEPFRIRRPCFKRPRGQVNLMRIILVQDHLFESQVASLSIPFTSKLRKDFKLPDYQPRRFVSVGILIGSVK